MALGSAITGRLRSEVRCRRSEATRVATARCSRVRVAVGGEQLLVGAAFGYTENKVDMGLSGFKLNEATGTLYAGYGEGPWYVGATLGASDLDYKNVYRNIALGATTRTESGVTKGYATTARALAGYWFNTGGNLVHGPIARVTWQEVKVRQFEEQGSSSTTMYFDQPNSSRLLATPANSAFG